MVGWCSPSHAQRNTRQAPSNHSGVRCRASATTDSSASCSTDPARRAGDRAIGDTAATDLARRRALGQAKAADRTSVLKVFCVVLGWRGMRAMNRQAQLTFRGRHVEQLGGCQSRHTAVASSLSSP
jgi:hypothetical protein